MCYTEGASWAGLAAAWTGCAALAAAAGGGGGGGAHWLVLAGALAVVGGMQLWDALLWRHRGACTPANATLSKLAAANNHAEPLVYWLLAHWLLTPRSRGRAQLAGGLIAAYALVFGALTLRFWRLPAEEQCTDVGRGGSLTWRWNQAAPAGAYALFILAALATTYAYMPAGVDHAVAATIVGTFGASYAQYAGEGAVGRMWCFYAAFLPWLALACA